MKVQPQAFIAIEHSELLSLLAYEPSTGLFRHKTGRGGVTAGSVAGTVNKGYVQISVKGKTWLAHILAWLYMTGSWPVHDVEHRDRVRTNNKWSNLRAATRRQNLANTGPRSTNKLGIKGVCYLPKRKKYRAQIMLKGRQVFLGHFDTLEEARSTYDIAHQFAHGDYSHARPA